MKFSVVILFLFLALNSRSQSVIIDGKLESSNNANIAFKDYSAELWSDDSMLIEKQRVNTAGNFTFQLKFAHDYYLSVHDKTEIIWRLLIHNKMEAGLVHYPITVEISPKRKEKDVYEIFFDKDGNKQYLKNKLSISEITYQFETGRRDTSEIIKK